MFADKKHVAGIIAGGGGTRFWPLSTRERPKQYLKLLTDKSLLQETYRRLSGIFSRENIFVITTSGQHALVREQLPDLPADGLIVEPELRDTCSACGFFTMLVKATRGEDAVIGLFPSDQHIKDVRSFARVVERAYKGAVSTGRICTIGISPDHPSTQYGYIKRGGDLGGGLFAAERFYEKPSADRAKVFADSADMFWNSGMFIWKASVFLSELMEHSPEHFKLLTSMFKSFGGSAFEAAVGKEYGRLPKISVDYAVMEKSDRIALVEGDFGWSDIGSWRSLYEFSAKDARGNCVKGKVKAMDCANSLIINDTPEPLFAHGMDGAVVVRAAAGTLVARLDAVDQARQSIAELYKGT